MCWKDLVEIYKNDNGLGGNQCSCEKRLLTFYMLFGLTCCSDSPLGPALGGVCLRIRIAFSQTRGCVPMAARQSVHGMPLMVRALGGVEPEGTHLERRKKLETSSQER